MYKDRNDRWQRQLCRKCPRDIVPGYKHCAVHRLDMRTTKTAPSLLPWSPMDDLVLLWCAYYRCAWDRLVALFPHRTEKGIRRRLDRLLARRAVPYGRTRRRRMVIKQYSRRTRIPARPSPSESCPSST